jgi:hypothetical protein
MSTDDTLVSPGAPDDEPGPTVTEADRLAAQVMDLIEQAAALIPELQGPHPLTSRGLRPARTVPRKFLLTMIAAVDDADTLRETKSFDSERARAVIQFKDAFRPVARRIGTLQRDLNHTIDRQVAGVVEAALTTYAVAKGLARDRGGAVISQHVANLKRDLARPKGRKKPPAE